MNEIFPGIFCIEERGKFLGIRRPPENLYVIAGKDGLIFDGGYGDKKTVEYFVEHVKKIEEQYKIEGKEFNLTRILPSHPHGDHVGGLYLIKKYLGVKIVLTETMAKALKNKQMFDKMHEMDYFEDYLNVPTLKNRIKLWFIKKISRYLYRKVFGVHFIDEADEIIEEESILIINDEEWKVFPSPGHCFGHISLYSENKGILFSGDNVLKSITTWLGPPDSNLDDYINSLQQLLDLPNLNLILPSHGSPIEAPRERIKELLAHRRKRTEEILRLVRNNSKNGVAASEIVKALYPNGTSRIRNMARGYVCLTLKKLEQEGLIKRTLGKNEFKFMPNEI
ncbi:MAG: MBL fold metallo-hydrolase [Promethearchaeota archaeon]